MLTPTPQNKQAQIQLRKSYFENFFNTQRSLERHKKTRKDFLLEAQLTYMPKSIILDGRKEGAKDGSERICCF